MVSLYSYVRCCVIVCCFLLLEMEPKALSLLGQVFCCGATSVLIQLYKWLDRAKSFGSVLCSLSICSQPLFICCDLLR